ncbi:GNAT family N-acetyltransferase [Nocardioides sambongensis]|uniref:GNAT family N-acetyltransferase n=1 Tax=Nocardioides sambongensis TaxID=2589074 RepID=UPI0018C8B562|nr:GNAT family protein [Nocardioides sambongensis]
MVGEASAQGAPTGPVVPGWEPRPAPEPVTLRGEHVAVVPLTSARYADLFATTCDPDGPDLWTYRPVERPRTLPELWMLLAAVAEADPTFALVPAEGPSAGRAAGIASLARVEPAHGQVEVAGVLLGTGLARTTAATEAIHLLMAYALDDLGYRRFEWKCDSLNEPSRRAAVRLGFTYEGRFRQHLVVKGRNRDTDWFSVTDAEWPRVGAAHRAWLAAENRDADGRQRRSLGSFLADA